VDASGAARTGPAPAGSHLDTTLLAETPEGIAIALRPAGAPARALAYLLDWLIRFIVYALALAMLNPLRGFGTGMTLLLYFLLEWIYPIVFELLPGAATPGKRVLGLQVLMDSGLPVTPAGAVVRNLLRAADFLPFAYAAGLLSMLLRHDFKRLGDVVAGTLVVHVAGSARHAALPAAPPLAPRTALSRPQQIAIMRLAGRAGRLTPQRLDELALQARGALPPAEFDGADDAPGPRLLGVARWLAGQRG